MINDKDMSNAMQYYIMGRLKRGEPLGYHGDPKDIEDTIRILSYKDYITGVCEDKEEVGGKVVRVLDYDNMKLTKKGKMKLWRLERIYGKVSGTR